MKKEKICNQHFVKDTHRNKKHTATIRCAMCEEESNLIPELPISVYDYIDFMKTFIKLHSMYGCNKERLKVPEWASSDMSIGITI